MAKKRVIEQKPMSTFEDRTSALPDDIIHRIVSFLPSMIAVRMSLISKEWRRMLTSIYDFDFNDKREWKTFYINHLRAEDKSVVNSVVIREWKQFYIDFVDECLEQRSADTTITKFKLHMAFCAYNPRRLDDWLMFPVQKNVKELDLYVRSNGWQFYKLPSDILRLRTLTLLKLAYINLEHIPKVSLPSLKDLYVEKAQMKDEALNNLMLGCPSLEKLHLDLCIGLVNPLVSSTSLQSKEFCGGIGCWKVQVETTNLHSFVYKIITFPWDESTINKWKINLAHCGAIRNLSFSYALITDQELEDLISRLPFLRSCNRLKHIKIKNHHLENLVFEDFRQPDSLEATIDTPSLVSLKYIGSSMIKISLHTLSLLWYPRLIEFLSELNGTRKVHIICEYCEEAFIIPEGLRERYPSPLPDLDYLMVKTTN